MPPEAAVATPAAEAQTANPASEAQATAPNGEASPNAQAGTDGQQPPANGATAQTAPDAGLASPAAPEGSPPPPTPPPSPPQLSQERLLELAEERIQAREAEKQAKAERDKTFAELRDLRRNGPKQARQVLHRIASEANVVIPPEYYDELENWAENLSLKATDAAKIELGDDAFKGLGDEQQAFVDACYASIDQSKRAEFTKEVDAKGHGDWLKAVVKFAPKSAGVVTVDDLVSEATAYAGDAANNLTEAEQAALTKALGAAKTPRAFIEALSAAMRGKGRADPGGGVAGGVRSSNGGPSSLDEARQMHAGMHPSGQTITNAQMRKYIASGSI